MTDKFILDDRLQQGSLLVGDLKLCSIRFKNNAMYPWLVLIPKVSNAREIIDLNSEDQHQLMNEIVLCSNAVKEIFSPYKLNVAALGNMVEQLHIHVIGRFKEDSAWPDPVFGKGEKAYDPSVGNELLAKLQKNILKL